MAIDIKAPVFPESVADGEVATWHKAEGDAVERDELIVEIETDKVVLEVVAPEDGTLSSILAGEGETVQSGQVLGKLEPGPAGESSEKSGEGAAKKGDKAGDRENGKQKDKGEQGADGQGEKPGTGKKTQTNGGDKGKGGDESPSSTDEQSAGDSGKSGEEPRMGPAARQLVEEHDLDPSRIEGTGKSGRVTKEDILRHLKELDSRQADAAPEKEAKKADIPDVPQGPSSERVERRVPMTRMRARIAERLLHATRETAMLTTFNEVNMSPVMELRAKYREQFEKTHNGTRLGFMGFFVKAACEALKRFPAVNASIDGNDIVYHGYQDIGVAVSTEGGLVVPVMRDADFMSLADIEAAIADLSSRARDNKLTIEDMTGGTFTVTNGGVFGSLLSTPILNPPQTGILGMHKIQERPMAVDGEVVVLPMMYLALSYDHRLVDGKTAVQFLVTIKDLIEDPARILLQL